MKLFSLAAAATLLASTGANAATVVFTGGSGTVTPGSTIITDFDEEVAAPGYIFQTGTNTQGAKPHFAEGSARYLAVLGGGTYSIAFGAVKQFSFDLGSLDTYNTLVLSFLGGATQTFVGGEIRGLAANFANSGDQGLPFTNGRVNFIGGEGQYINGATFKSSTNSFEADRLAGLGAVPEPATWAMMILGFGITGFAMRTRRKTAANAFAA